MPIIQESYGPLSMSCCLQRSSNNRYTNISSQSFNDYFTTIGANVVRSNVTLNYCYQWKLPESIYVFNFVPVDEATVYKLLSTLSDQPRKDVIGMDCKLLQISAAIITPSLKAGAHERL